jgi:hypothetical protein
VELEQMVKDPPSLLDVTTVVGLWGTCGFNILHILLELNEYVNLKQKWWIL